MAGSPGHATTAGAHRALHSALDCHPGFEGSVPSHRNLQLLRQVVVCVSPSGKLLVEGTLIALSYVVAT